ncbi:MAG: helix-turn-helix transcriptional regulator [Rhizobiales bacterium]|nr:helix-turn-helix transcriptional regulator [Hyphomicrobiales bacterium]
MNAQIITSPNGERLVVIPEADFNSLVAAAEDAADIGAVHRFKERLSRGEEELVPAAVVERLLAGENPVRVWREHRGLSMSAVASMANIAQPFLSQIETGKRDGTVDTLKKLAATLNVTIDDLI